MPYKLINGKFVKQGEKKEPDFFKSEAAEFQLSTKPEPPAFERPVKDAPGRPEVDRKAEQEDIPRRSKKQ